MTLYKTILNWWARFGWYRLIPILIFAIGYPVIASVILNLPTMDAFFKSLFQARSLLNAIAEFFIILAPGVVSFWGFPIQDRGDRTVVILLCCLLYLPLMTIVSFFVAFAVACIAPSLCVLP